MRGAYEIDVDHELVRALRESYTEVTGKPLEPVGMKVVADAAIFCGRRDPDRLPRPRRLGRARRCRVHDGRRELVRATKVYLALLRRLF